MSLKRTCLITSLLINTLIFNPLALSTDGLMLNYGIGMNDWLVQSENLTGAKQATLGAFWKTDFNYQKAFFQYDELEIETYLSHITKDQQAITLIGLRPIFSFWQKTEEKHDWYWQFGVGVSYFDSKELSPIKLSTRPQFATILGVGMPFDKAHKHRITLRYNHYSNAYIKRPNPGLDTFSLDWHWQFDNDFF